MNILVVESVNTIVDAEHDHGSSLQVATRLWWALLHSRHNRQLMTKIHHDFVLIAYRLNQCHLLHRVSVLERCWIDVFWGWLAWMPN